MNIKSKTESKTTLVIGRGFLHTSMFCVMLLFCTNTQAQDFPECLSGPNGTLDPMCANEIQLNPIQKVQTVFKFQARISQAKLPVGDVIFNKVYVNILGGPVPCKETLEKVKVIGSVLNLEIGRNITNCVSLDDTIASAATLKVQICIENESNCLSPISLSTVPYAVKSTFAQMSQEANAANTAAECHYTHRATADNDLFVRGKIGKGYFDFHTPVPEKAQLLFDSGSEMSWLSDDGSSNNYENGGYLLWTPVQENQDANLHIAAKDMDDETTPEHLNKLIIHSRETALNGSLKTYGFAEVTEDLTVAKNTNVGVDLDVVHDAKVHNSIIVDNNAKIKNSIVVEDNASFGTLTSDGQVLNNRQCEMKCNSTLYGETTFKNDATAEKDLTVEEKTTMEGVAQANKGLLVFGGALFADDDPYNDDIDENIGNLADGMCKFKCESKFLDKATFGSVDFLGDINLTPPENQNKSLTVYHDTYFKNSIVVGDPLGENGQAPAGKSVDFNYAVNFNGPVNLPPPEQLGISINTQHIAANAVTNSKLGLTLQEYHANSNDHTYVTTDMGNHVFCGLTEFDVIQERGKCRIAQNDGSWTLKAYQAMCTAQCF